ncbi:nucleotide-binding protein [Mesorhizobium sp. M1328]|uniref:TIR domain-containing protein n=1 Tax=Mesorhizobium sp. M1328 TaxID=2957082 RepID=UPI00333C6BA9
MKDSSEGIDEQAPHFPWLAGSADEAGAGADARPRRRRACRSLDDILQSGHDHADRLLELTREVDFAAFVFARDDWTTASLPASPPAGSGQASPRDNVVFEAGLFSSVLGLRRTFILHASGSKPPTDLLGLTCVRYGEATNAAEMRTINQKLRKAIESEGRLARIEGLWWQFSLSARGPREPSAVRPPAHLASPRRYAGAAWPLMAGGRHSVRQILERSPEGEEGACRRFLLLERRTAPRP